MRNPNYRYEPNNGYSESHDGPVGGWLVIFQHHTVWGRTKAAARSRLKRILRRNAKTEQKEEVNEQS